MSTSLPEFKKMNATGIGREDENTKEGGIDREGVLGQRPPTSIVATGKRNSSIRKGMFDRSTESR